MFKSFTTLCVAILFVLVLSGCEKDCVSPKGIYGDWIWIKTDDNHHGYTSTPEGLGYTEKLSIDDFTYKQFINDSLVYESQYDLIIKTDSLNHEGKFIVFPSGYEQRIHVDETELIVTETFLLINPTSYYKRI